MNTVSVLYKYVDGAHFFVSNDEKTLGLCVAHKDPEKAFEAVSIQLSKLFKENYGVSAEFIPDMSSVAFLKWFAKQNKEALSSPKPGTAGMIEWSRAEVLQAS